MRICHITAHLPPDQAANALLPFHLGAWARKAGDEPSYVAHPPRAGGPAELPGQVVWVPSHHNEGGLARLTKIASLSAALRIVRAAGPVIAAADLVHVHSNGLLAEIGAWLAARKHKPFVLTLYGTEIWHYAPRRFAPDLFTHAYRHAAHVTFYSHGLSSRALELGLVRRETSVIYPPVAREFQWRDASGQTEARTSLGWRNRHVLLNVKRLHPLAGQRFLIEALSEVIRTHPDTRLVICGTGPLRQDLQRLARSVGVEGHTTFAGLVENRLIARYCMAADTFVLPSLLEACPTVALEALACGTPVITSDSPGGVEINDLFGPDVTVVPRQNVAALARAMVDVLENKHRTRPGTAALIERDFRPCAVAAQFHTVYERALASGRPS